MFSIIIPIETAVPLSVFISVLVALVVVIQDHKQIHLHSAKWLILFSAPGIPIGIVGIYGNELVVYGNMRNWTANHLSGVLVTVSNQSALNRVDWPWDRL